MANYLRVDLSDYSIGKHSCLNPDCTSSDGMHVYGDNAYCFVCSTTFFDKGYEGERKPMEKKLKELSQEDRKRITSLKTNGKNYRGVLDTTYDYFRFRHEYDDLGNLVAQYAPVTRSGELSGYKKRTLPKDFMSIGEVGNTCDFVGQSLFKTFDHTVMIVGGEVDMCSAYQMLKQYSDSRNSQFNPVAVVSPSIGENCATQAKNNYDFFNQFKKIIICLDADEAGQKATEKLVNVLPSGKVFLMKMRYKDPNKYLENGKQNEFISDFFAAKELLGTEITAFSSTYDDMLDYVSNERYSLPPMFKEANEMLRGGLPTAGIVNIFAASGIGKSTFVDAITLHMTRVNHVVTSVLSFEASNGEYAANLVSSVSGTKIQYLATKEERVDFVKSDIGRKTHKLISTGIDGQEMLYLIDVELDVEDLQDTIVKMIKTKNTKVFVIDVFSDLCDVIGKDAVPPFMAWLKSMFKKYGVLFILVNHTRKSSSGAKAGSEGAKSTEEDIIGSSTVYKSGGVNIGITRDKSSDDEITRNTSFINITKARGVGKTGDAGSIFYDLITHRSYATSDFAIGDLEKYQDYYDTYFNLNTIEL